MPAPRGQLNGARMLAGHHEKIDGLQHLDKVIDIDQSPIGRTPRSESRRPIPAAFTQIRDWFAQPPRKRSRAVTSPGRFSFNVKGGRCEACTGRWRAQDRNALPARRLCDVRRVPRRALQPRNARSEVQGQEHRRRARHDSGRRGRVLQGGAADPREDGDAGRSRPRLCESRASRRRRCRGGEAQRVKLAKELSRRATGQHAVYPRRADDGPAFRGCPQTARSAPRAGGARAIRWW